jgi:hypothetical protein
VNHGDDVTLDARANTAQGWEFSNWSGCSNSTSPSLRLSDVTGNERCTANFDRPPHTLTAAVSPATAGRVTCASGCSVPYGNSQTLTVTPNAGYQVQGWSCASGRGTSVVVSSVTSNQSCTVTLARNDHTVTVRTSGSASGSVEASVNGVACAGQRCVVPDGESVIMRVRTTAGRQVFDGWSSCSPSAAVSEGGGAYRSTLSNVSSDQTCIANIADLSVVNFRSTDTRCGTVVPTVSPAANGVSCDGDSCTARANSTVTLNFTSRDAGGCTWSGWRCTGSPAVRISGNFNYTASFSGFSGQQTASCTLDVGMAN